MPRQVQTIGPPLPVDVHAHTPINHHDIKAQGMTACWPGQFSAGTRNLRDVIGSFSGELTGDVVWANDPQMGPVLRCNGTGYIDTPYIPLSYPMSCSIWFRTTNANAGVLIGWGSTSSGNPMIDTEIYLGQVYQLARTSAENEAVQTSPNTYHDGKWHHADFIFAAENLRQLFVDGILLGTSTTNIAGISVNTTKIGCIQRSDGYLAQFDGDIALPSVRYAAHLGAAWQAWAPQTRWHILNRRLTRRFPNPGSPSSSTIHQRRQATPLRVGLRSDLAC